MAINSTFPDCLDHLLQLTDLGYRLFPVAPGAKSPLTTQGCKDATSDWQAIQEWADRFPECNWGLATDGLVVIDIDGVDNPWPIDQDQAASLLNAGAITSTPRGGRHYFFRQPEGKGWRNTASKVAEKVDTRVNGGYVVLAGSSTPDGQYQWLDGCELTQAPGELPEPPDWLVRELDKIGKKPSQEKAQANQGTIPEGQRNGTLASIGGSLRRIGLNQSEILAALLEINTRRCQPRLEVAEVERIADSISKYEPGKISGQDVPSGTQRLQIVSAGQFSPKPMRWLSPRVLPLGVLTMLVADAGTGKSSIVRSVIANLLKGKGILASNDGPVEVLVCLAEDSMENHYIPALLSEGCTREEIDRLKWVTGVLRPDQTEEEFSANSIPLIEKAIQENPGIKLVLVDPLAGMVANAGLKMDAQEGARVSSGRLHTLAKHLDIAVLQLAHEVKSKEVQGANRAAGSHQHVASARLVWQLKKCPNGLYLKPVKANFPLRKTEVVQFTMHFVGEEMAKGLLEQNGYGDLIQSFEDSGDPDCWDAFHFQEINIVPTKQFVSDISDDPIAAQEQLDNLREEREVRREREAVKAAEEAIIAMLDRKAGPVKEGDLVDTIRGRKPEIQLKHISQAIAVLVDDGDQVIKLEQGGNKGALLVHVSHRETVPKPTKVKNKRSFRKSNCSKG